MENENIKIKILYYIIILSFVLFIFWPKPSEKTSVFSLETPTIPHLEPHEHNHEDSIMIKSHHKIVYSQPKIIKEDLWVKGFKYSIKNARETVLHHAVLAILNEKDVMCTNRNGKHLLGIGEDQLHDKEVILPEGYAILIPRKSQLFFYTMLHNPKPPIGYGENHYDVSSLLELYLADRSEISSLRPVEFIRLDLTDKPCGSQEESYVFRVPANVGEFTFGLSTEKLLTSSYTFSESGKIIYMGGHIHGWENGKYISVYINGKLIKKYETKKAQDDPYRYDTPHQEENIPIIEGDVLSITATYENNEKKDLTGAMAMLGLYFAKE